MMNTKILIIIAVVILLVIVMRKKEGFNAPIHFWVEKWPDKIKEELLGNTSSALENLISRQAIETWIKSRRKRKQAGASLYALFILNKWIASHDH